jgi:hypothetical protein
MDPVGYTCCSCVKPRVFLKTHTLTDWLRQQPQPVSLPTTAWHSLTQPHTPCLQVYTTCANHAKAVHLGMSSTRGSQVGTLHCTSHQKCPQGDPLFSLLCSGQGMGQQGQATAPWKALDMLYLMVALPDLDCF